MTNFRIPSWLVPVVLLTALVASYSVYKRHQVESKNKATALAVEYETIEALAAGQGLPLDRAIAELKSQGLGAVVLSEEFIGELINQGRLTLSSTSVPAGEAQPTIKLSSLTFNDLSVFPRVQRGLQIRFGALSGTLAPRGKVLSLPPVSAQLIRSTSIGLNPTQAGTAQRNGLMIVARASNPSGASSQAVRQTLGWAKEMGASVFLPQGDQVLGRRDALKATTESLKGLGLLYATPEFAKIGGDANVVEEQPENIVRLHSAQVAELDKLSLPAAVERYVKAARERNMRILMVRPVSLGADQPLSNFGTFIRAISDGIRNEGAQIGTPHGFEDPKIPRPLFLVLGLLGAAVSFGAVASLVRDRKLLTVAAVLLGLLGLACWVKSGQQVMALVVSMALPVIGFLAIDALRPSTSLPTLVRALIAFLMVSVFSLIGGLYVAGMLNGLPYYVGGDEFRGIKISLFLPVLLIGAAYTMRLTDWRSTLKGSITWGTVLLGLFLIAGFGLMIARTGNDSGVGASGIEVLFRNFLDNSLFVRPRTKEFLVGHPALIVGIAMLYRYVPQGDAASGPRSRALLGWIALVLAIGAVGQTDIVNTLCHLHIPAALSVVRVLIGIFLGCIVGSVLWIAVSRLLPKPEN